MPRRFAAPRLIPSTFLCETLGEFGHWGYNLPYQPLGHSYTMANPCKHPKVRVVSRQDDVEFVECQDCGEVFDSDEFRDMEIEGKAGLDREDELEERQG